jgi:dTDP-4-dehydrorhamnose 3,5-epimerase
MRAIDQPLPGVRLLELAPRFDERGFFARAFCRTTLADLEVGLEVAQANLSSSLARGTLRGLHYQLPP